MEGRRDIFAPNNITAWKKKSKRRRMNQELCRLHTQRKIRKWKRLDALCDCCKSGRCVARLYRAPLKRASITRQCKTSNALLQTRRNQRACVRVALCGFMSHGVLILHLHRKHSYTQKPCPSQSQRWIWASGVWGPNVDSSGRFWHLVSHPSFVLPCLYQPWHALQQSLEPFHSCLEN